MNLRSSSAFSLYFSMMVHRILIILKKYACRFKPRVINSYFLYGLVAPNYGLLPPNDRWWLHFRFIIKLYKSTNRSVCRAGCNLFRAAADGFLRQYFVRVHKPTLIRCRPASADALARRKERKNWSCCVLYLTLKAEWQTC